MTWNLAFSLIFFGNLGTYKSNEFGIEFDGTWENGEPYQGTRYFKDGRTYTGHFKHFLLQGPGEVIYPNGTILEGKFVNGIPEGHLIYTFPNGDVRSGVFKINWTGRYNSKIGFKKKNFL